MSTTQHATSPSHVLPDYFNDALRMDNSPDPITVKNSTKDDDDEGDESSSLICRVGGGGDAETIVIVSRVGGDEGDDFGHCGRVNMSLLQVQQAYADVCRICHCGPNTIATPTPTVLTPATSPKKFNNTPSNNASINLKHQFLPPPNHQQDVIPPPQPTIPQSPPSKKLPPPQPPDYNLISPCICSGSLKYVHQCCLQHWIRASSNTSCELCKHPYELRSKFKPLWKWESLPMSSREKKRVVCSALFHTVALACVVWSLYVLIDRTVEELTHSDLEWQFWTKIIVEAIGCLGAGILTYVWGKSYVGLFIKWISFNRSFTILGKEHRTSIPSNPSSPTTDEPQQRKETGIVPIPSQFPGTSAAGQSQSTLQELNTAIQV